MTRQKKIKQQKNFIITYRMKCLDRELTMEMPSDSMKDLREAFTRVFKDYTIIKIEEIKK